MERALKWDTSMSPLHHPLVAALQYGFEKKPAGWLQNKEAKNNNTDKPKSDVQLTAKEKQIVLEAMHVINMIVEKEDLHLIQNLAHAMEKTKTTINRC